MAEIEDVETSEQVEKIQQSMGAESQAEKASEGGKKILMVVAQENFKDEEYFTPKSRFESAGFEVKTVSSTMGTATSVGGQEVEVFGIEGENGAGYDAIVLIGGPGITSHYTDTEYQQVAKQAYDGGKVVAAICLAPNILANAGILDGKRATVFGSEAQLVSHGGQYTGEAVTVDGNIVTGIGPDAATEFAEAVVTKLSEPGG